MAKYLARSHRQLFCRKLQISQVPEEGQSVHVPEWENLTIETLHFLVDSLNMKNAEIRTVWQEIRKLKIELEGVDAALRQARSEVLWSQRGPRYSELRQADVTRKDLDARFDPYQVILEELPGDTQDHVAKSIRQCAEMTRSPVHGGEAANESPSRSCSDSTSSSDSPSSSSD